MAKHGKQEIAAQLERGREWFPPGSIVHTILDHVSKSGMSRDIRFLMLRCKDGELDTRHPNHMVEVLLGLPRAKRGDGVRVGGCGMDMGFECVYNLGRVLYPEGFECVGENCPSNDHSNGDRCYTPHMHRDGGYALRHKWL